MSAFWEGVGTGIGTSALVAIATYLVQRRDSNRSSSELSNRIDASTSFAKEALRTTLQVRAMTNTVHKAVLSGQLRAAGNPNSETMGAEHIAAAEEFLASSTTDAYLNIQRLHCNLVGKEVLYAGVLRDANSVVSGHSERDSPLIPIPADQIPTQLKHWLGSLSKLLSLPQPLERGEALRAIAKLHADLMWVHPFFDGNGLVGRALLAAIVQRLLGQSCFIPRADPEYFLALRNALAGEPEALGAYIGERCEA